MNAREQYFQEYNAKRAEQRREYERERYRQKKAGELKPPEPATRCAYCGGAMPAGKRADAVYCSASCIKKAKRQRDPEHERELRRQAHARSNKQKRAEYMREYMREYRQRKRGEKQVDGKRK